MLSRFNQSTEKAGCFGPQKRLQTPVGITSAVPTKLRRSISTLSPFKDFENQIDAVLVAFDDLGLKHGGDAALRLVIGWAMAFGVFFPLGSD